MNTIPTHTIIQLIRYGIIGVTSNALAYAGYLLIVYAGCGEKLSMTLMYLAGATYSYSVNYRWTFKKSGRAGAPFRYIQMHVSGYVINLILLYVFFDQLHYPHEIVQASAIILLAAYSFLACKYYVFRENPVTPLKS
ncbi:GtrA family protein [Pseudomonas protegens]|uniref:GtrA family protein n=1 Tax=Pseudomonas protegens TaxID=380021 RepID=UPI00130DCC64